MPKKKEITPPLRQDIENAINRWSAENGSNTPDWILAKYLTDCLAAFDAAVNAREKWYGRTPAPIPGEPINLEATHPTP